MKVAAPPAISRVPAPERVPALEIDPVLSKVPPTSSVAPLLRVTSPAFFPAPVPPVASNTPPVMARVAVEAVWIEATVSLTEEVTV